MRALIAALEALRHPKPESFRASEAVPFYNCANPRVFPQPLKPCPSTTLPASCVSTTDFSAETRRAEAAC